MMPSVSRSGKPETIYRSVEENKVNDRNDKDSGNSITHVHHPQTGRAIKTTKRPRAAQYLSEYMDTPATQIQDPVLELAHLIYAIQHQPAS